MQVRPYVSKDLKGIQNLFRQRDVPFNEERFLWKKHCPGQLSLVGVEDEEVIAHYSILPMPLPFGDSSLRAGFAVDGIFHPRKAQLDKIQQMLQVAKMEAQSHGLSLLVGFPNSRMAPVKKFLGWQEWSQVQWVLSKGSCGLKSFKPKSSFFPESPYHTWRWAERKADYWHYQEDDIHAVFGEMGFPARALLWINSENAMWRLARKLPFVCMHMKGDLPEQFTSLESKKETSLLYLPLIPLERIGLAPLWYGESLEGVTLGW